MWWWLVAQTEHAEEAGVKPSRLTPPYIDFHLKVLHIAAWPHFTITIHEYTRVYGVWISMCVCLCLGLKWGRERVARRSDMATSVHGIMESHVATMCLLCISKHIVWAPEIDAKRPSACAARERALASTCVHPLCGAPNPRGARCHPSGTRVFRL